MSTLLDEETIVLDVLDFEPACEIQNGVGVCGEDATHWMQCNTCGADCGHVCIDHAIYARTSTRRLRHQQCETEDALRDLVTVVAL